VTHHHTFMALVSVLQLPHALAHEIPIADTPGDPQDGSGRSPLHARASRPGTEYTGLGIDLGTLARHIYTGRGPFGCAAVLPRHLR